MKKDENEKFPFYSPTVGYETCVLMPINHTT